MANSLVLIRHGQSQWNLENRFTGWVDVPLTSQGEVEAKAAGQKLKSLGFKPDIAFTSDLQRAQKTLAIVLEEIQSSATPVTRHKALNERHYGDLQGKNKAETAAQFGDEQVKIWRRSYDIAPPNGESLKDTAARTLPYFKGPILDALKSGKNVLIAAHGNSLRSIVMELEKLTPAEILEKEIPTGGALVYEFDSRNQTFKKKTT
jgi:2,3-bisphosphoglycerate-dependent phosphoglycerate mutase